MTKRAIVLDANILVRAVLGQRVRTHILDHAGDVSFFAPDTAFDEAREHLPALPEKRGVTAGPALDFLAALEKVVRPIDAELYQPLEATSLARIGDRDPDDWPALACALLLDCPVWTEDADFFGTGVATWDHEPPQALLGCEPDLQLLLDEDEPSRARLRHGS